MQEPTITLIIATYNWKEALGKTLESAFNQIHLPTEIIVADDGSREDTRQLIEAMIPLSPVPLIHVWHPDEGFRLSAIRNKAIARATGDYIVQVDGDIVLEKHFIADHVEQCQEGYFVCGSRVRLTAEISEELLRGVRKELRRRGGDRRYILNTFRSKLLRRYLAHRYKRGDIMRLRGCNMAFWRSDLLAVNGYNELLTEWGHEDSELAYRLINSGCKKKMLKMGGIAYHLYHKENSKANEDAHYQAIEEVKQKGISYCPQGIDNYLPPKEENQ